MAGSDELVSGYAEALFRVLQAEGELDSVEDELYRFGKLLDDNYELKRALSEQGVDHATRVKILEELLGNKVSPHTIGLLTFIVAQDRARELPQILEEVSRIAAESRDSALAEVRSAVPLDDEQRTQLT
ncbi:MAG: F0F1 ATP synthase subunit delta, partial [Actinobacteria bacterium]|nr:F0F1 ATP synthase subunit delta [Actinomycetota bacterium]